MTTKGEQHQDVSRRDLLKVAGAGATLAGLAVGCTPGGSTGEARESSHRTPDPPKAIIQSPLVVNHTW